MKMRTLSALAGAGVPLILAGPASAAFVGLKAVNKPNALGILTYNIYAQFTEREGDFVFAVAGTLFQPLNVNVRGGTFYQNSFSGDLAPNVALCAILPSVCFDTFVTIGKKTSTGNATALAPGWPGFGPDRLAFNDTGWFITPDDAQGQPNANNQVLLLQLSTLNGLGFFGTIQVNGFSNGQAFAAYVSFDTQEAPAPGALALLGAAGLLGCRRRRRA
jgi:MYXO-CTERM domain-containing protein